jgi:adenylate cyclase
MADPSPAERLIAWLHAEGRLVDSAKEFAGRVGPELRAVGLPVDRLTTGIPLLHPQLDSSAAIWEDDEADERLFAMAPENYKMRLNSPLHAAYFDGESTRVPITPEPVEGEFGVVPDLRAKGYTDYVCYPAPFSDGTNKAMTFATRAAGGFDEEHLATLEGVMPAFAMALEVVSLKRTARSLLDTYLGERAGEQVLAGQVRRGHGEQMHAVIWFCDLRRSTPLAESLDPAAFLLLLADYFDCMAAAVLDGGGLVLRYIGDAVLAIFPTDEGDAHAARAAVAAATEALRRLDALNEERVARGEEALGAGIGLHLGDVMYGNIGTASRLEFTVIGSAANTAARVEGLCKTLGERLVFSSVVAEHLEEEVRSLGAHALRGVGGELEVYTLASSVDE